MYLSIFEKFVELFFSSVDNLEYIEKSDSLQ